MRPLRAPRKGQGGRKSGEPGLLAATGLVHGYGEAVELPESGRDIAYPARAPMKPSTQRLEIHIPFSTILRILLTLLAVYCLIKLWPELVFLLLSLLLAVALNPIVAWAESRRVPRVMAVLVLALGILGLISAIAAAAAPPLVTQVVTLMDDLPALRERTLANMPPSSHWGRGVVEKLFELTSPAGLSPYMNQTLVVGKTTLSGVATMFFVFITTLYLLIDGKRLYAWVLAYVPRAHRPRVAETVPEVSRVVTGYVRGQLLTSVLFACVAAIILHLFQVPAALPLALLAGACDIIPVVGIIIATIPAALLALTVSPLKAAMVVAAYILYHQIEAYVIVPRVQGSTLRLSTLAVLLALLVGGTLQGLLGVILILPIVAAYPIIERIWLKEHLAPEVIRDHRALERAAESGSDEAVDAVLQGVKHSDESLTPPEVEEKP